MTEFTLYTEIHTKMVGFNYTVKRTSSNDLFLCSKILHLLIKFYLKFSYQ